ncbi:MAG: hypothetical protein WC097_01555 [Eubacteriales bacterium]
MATKFEFYLSEEDTDRVFLLKEKAGEADLTANEYAKELLIRELHRQHPSTPRTDEDGNYIE